MKISSLVIGYMSESIWSTWLWNNRKTGFKNFFLHQLIELSKFIRIAFWKRMLGTVGNSSNNKFLGGCVLLQDEQLRVPLRNRWVSRLNNQRLKRSIWRSEVRWERSWTLLDHHSSIMKQTKNNEENILLRFF